MLQTSFHRPVSEITFQSPGVSIFYQSRRLSQDKSDVQSCVHANDWRATDKHVGRCIQVPNILTLEFATSYSCGINKSQVTEILIAAVRKDVSVSMSLNTKQALETNQVKRKYLQDNKNMPGGGEMVPFS